MSNNCFVVTARPTDQTKFDTMVKCLKGLRQVTNDTIILSLNYLPSNIDQISDLYDALVYSNSNESYDTEECHFTYSLDTHLFTLEVDCSNREYGRAANNLRYRAYKLAQTLNKTEYTFLDYDCFIDDPKFLEYLSKQPVFFFQGTNSGKGDPLVETWFYKLNDETARMLEFFSDKERYFNYMDQKDTNNVLFYETGLYRYLKEHNLLNFIHSKFDFSTFNIKLDTNFSEFRTYEHEGAVWLCIEYMTHSHPMFVEVEYNGVLHELGNMKGRWQLLHLGPYYEGMSYKAIINGETTRVVVTPDSYNNTTITFKD